MLIGQSVITLGKGWQCVMCDVIEDPETEAFRTQNKIQIQILPKLKIISYMNETKTPSKIKNSEETENDEDDDALKHVNLFSKYQNRSLKFGAGTFFSRTENRRLRRKHTHTNRTPRRCRGGIITRCD